MPLLIKRLALIQCGPGLVSPLQGSQTDPPRSVMEIQVFPLLSLVGPVVQLVRMPPCHGGGRGFESRPVRINTKYPTKSGVFCIAYRLVETRTLGFGSRLSREK